VKVLGVDPGSTTVGYGLVETGRDRFAHLLECGVLKPRAGMTLAGRLRVIHDGMGELIARHRPDMMAVEDIFVGKNPRSSAVLGHARGVILLSAEESGLPIAEYSPATIKQTVVGRGGALKTQVGYMVAQLLRLAEAPAPADAADGVAVALTHLLRARGPAGRMAGMK